MHKLMRYIKGYERQALLAPLFKMLEACFELFVPLVIASIFLLRSLLASEIDA